MPWSSQALRVQLGLSQVKLQELNCTPKSVRNAGPISGVRTGVVAMGEEYLEEDAGDAREVDAKNCPLSGAIRGVGARSNGELVETTEVSSGSRIKGTATI